jgi:Holliday junction resolvase RusA-like endonuclease
MGLNSRRHWRAVWAENQRWLKRVDLATVGKRPEHPLAIARIALARYSSREPDWDNMVSSFKPILDALETLRVIENDRMSVIGQPQYYWRKAPRGQGLIEVRVWEPEPPHSISCSGRGVKVVEDEPPDEVA